MADGTTALRRCAIAHMADFVANGDVSLGATARSTVHTALVDTIGCICAGVASPAAQRVRTALAQFSAGGSASLIGTDLTLAPPYAALANAVAGHAYDFDDWEVPGNTHTSVVLFPALLAGAAGKALAGERLAEAYVVGFEVIARLGEALNFDHYDRGWHTTVTLGALGSAAAVARLKGLDQEQAGHALALSVSQAVGYTCQFGSNAKPLQAGLAAQAGVMSVAFAEAGMTGQLHAFDGPTGMVALMGHGDVSRIDAVLQRLGRPLAIDEHGIVFKMYPSCGYTHRVMDCAVAVRGQGGFDPLGVVAVSASLPDFHAAILPFRMPQSRPEALFSIPFCVAVVLARGGLGLEDLEAEVWNDDDIARLIEQTTVDIRTPLNPSLNYDPDDPDWLEVTMSDGQVLRAQSVYPVGAPQVPLSAEQIREKLVNNVMFAGVLDRHEAVSYADRLDCWIEQDDIFPLLETSGEF